MRETFAYLQSFAGFPRALRAYLRDPLTLQRARAIVADRFAHREANFLRIVEHSIYRHPSSPYLALLRHAGCERGDLEATVDIAMINNQTVWTAISKGADLRTIGPFTATTGTLGAHAAIRSCADLDGKTVRRDWASQHAGAVRDVLLAQLLAYRKVNQNPRILFDESVKRLSLDADTAQAVGRFHLGMRIWDDNGLLTTDNVQSTIDFLVKANALPAGMQPAQVLDLSNSNAVLGEIGRVPRGPVVPKDQP